MPVWPDDMPCSIRGKSRSPQSNVAAFGTEVGPGKVRRRSTARTRRMSIPFVLTRIQANQFEEFFNGDLQDGSLPFFMKDPFTGLDAEWRFDPDSPYDLNEMPSGKYSLATNMIRLP